jgi:anti-sigma factor (TIGR02949 family)
LIGRETQVKKMKLTVVTCRGALARLYEYIDGELSSVDARAVRVHLKVCRACSKRFHFEEQLLGSIREKSRTAAIPEDLRKQIESVLDEL